VVVAEAVMTVDTLIDDFVAVRVRYDARTKAWLARSGHYLDNPPPGALFVLSVQRAMQGLFGIVGDGELRGLCVIGRPIARMLPQDGSWGEIVRFVLQPGLPHGIASALLRSAASYARSRRKPMRVLIAYHDRTRHTGCIYRKAGFRRDGVVTARPVGWGNRSERTSASYDATPKRRWRLDLQ
jgi:GNAT superfamily N-acetyltransferase